MQRFLGYLTRINFPLLLLVLFVAHALMYRALGTHTWLTTSLMATGFYGVVIYALRTIRNRPRVK